MNTKFYITLILVIGIVVLGINIIANARITNPESILTLISGGSTTAGSVIFSNGTDLAEDNTNLFWDDANNRLGILDATPGQSFVVGAAELFTVDSSGNASTTGYVQIGKVIDTVSLVSGDLFVGRKATVTSNFVVGADFTVDTTTFFVDSTLNFVGVATVTPVVAFDVLGSTRMFPDGTATPTCNANLEGALLYSTGTGAHFGCNGTAWTALY